MPKQKVAFFYPKHNSCRQKGRCQTSEEAFPTFLGRMSFKKAVFAKFTADKVCKGVVAPRKNKDCKQQIETSLCSYVKKNVAQSQRENHIGKRSERISQRGEGIVGSGVQRGNYQTQNGGKKCQTQDIANQEPLFANQIERKTRRCN